MVAKTQATWAQIPVEAEASRESGLWINTRGQVEQSAGRYLPNAGPARGKALASFRPENRAHVEAFDAAADMRAKGQPRRVRRLHKWGNRTFAGVVVVPAVRPVRSVLEALACADMGGPLEHWLLLYAAEQFDRWPKVERHLLAMGYRSWACQDAAMKLLNTGDSYKDGALRRRMNQQRYAAELKAVEAVLWDWLERASHALLEQMGGAQGGETWVGEGRQTDFSQEA